MVVRLALDPFPDIEDTLIAYISMLGLVPPENVDTVKPADGEDGIEILRVGGTDDTITDFPRVEINCYSDRRNTARNMAETVRQAMQNDLIRASAIEFTDEDGLRWAVQIDNCATDTPPENVGYRNPERRRRSAFYRLALRRPRTPPRKG